MHSPPGGANDFNILWLHSSRNQWKNVAWLLIFVHLTSVFFGSSLLKNHLKMTKNCFSSKDEQMGLAPDERKACYSVCGVVALSPKSMNSLLWSFFISWNSCNICYRCCCCRRVQTVKAVVWFGSSHYQERCSTGKKQHPARKETVVCCNQNTFLATVCCLVWSRRSSAWASVAFILSAHVWACTACTALSIICFWELMSAQ